MKDHQSFLLYRGTAKVESALVFVNCFFPVAEASQSNLAKV